MKTTTTPGLRRTYVNLKKDNWDRYRQEVEAALSKRSLPTDFQRDEKIVRTVVLKAASHHIPTGRHMDATVSTPPACTSWNRSSIQDRRQVDQGFYGVESVVRGNADSLLMLALSGDVHLNPGPSRYPCSVCFKNVTSQGTSYLCTRWSHWVHSRCSGLRNAADYRKANGWICTACMTPPQPRAPSPPTSPAHHVRQDVQHTTVKR